MGKIKILKIVAVISGILTIYMFNQEIANTASSVGIIGSADGPTYIYVASSSNIFSSIVKYGTAVICLISIVLVIFFKKKK